VLIRCRDLRVYLFSADFHFFFDDGLDDSVAEVDIFLFEFGYVAIQVSENLVQLRHYFPAPRGELVCRDRHFSRDGSSVKNV
jgi:hypothetical protein